jgi:hypothetical protein
LRSKTHTYIYIYIYIYLNSKHLFRDDYILAPAEDMNKLHR